PLEIREDCVERLSMLGSGLRQRSANITGFDARQNRIAVGMFEVVGDPVSRPVSLLAEIGRLY
ncbi:MAG TPA: hypothetical protein VFZ98_12300, partial [Vicinamibacterales bacterium]